MWEISLELGSGKPAVMRNINGTRTLVQQCADLNEAMDVLTRLEAKAGMKKTTVKLDKNGKPLPPWLQPKDATDGDTQDEKAATSKQPYGDVEYADPGYQADKKARYPINDPDHVRAALSYFGNPKNAGEYTASQRASILAKINAAAKKFGIK